MPIFKNILLSLAILVVCAFTIYPTAYAFEFPYTLKTVLQYLQMLLTLASIIVLWMGHPQLALAGVGVVFVITAAILAVNGILG